MIKITDISNKRPIQLIVRTTSRCNFNCTFCSASKLKGELSVDQVLDNVRKYQPIQSLIFEGGEPTILPPEYYWKIINTIKQENLKVDRFGMTTNLWDFHKHPEKWVDLFKLDNFDVCTSFQYGNKRKIGNKVFTEDIFVQIFSQYKALVGKPLPFIAVIDSDNKDTVIDTVLLAKRLGTSCKLNPAFVAGRQNNSYSFCDMLSDYFKIIDSGLGEYEDNCQSILDKINHTNTVGNNCPWVRDCSNGIRCVSPNNEVSTCSIENSWIVNKAPINSNGERDITLNKKALFIKPQCLKCELFDWCNSCRVMILQNQKDPTFCQKMKTLYATRKFTV